MGVNVSAIEGFQSSLTKSIRYFLKIIRSDSRKILLQDVASRAKVSLLLIRLVKPLIMSTLFLQLLL